jgi:hypothetical protein
MKPHKNRYKTRAKKSEKQMVIKNQIKKMRKDNKMLSQKSKKEAFFLTKDNKKKESKIKFLAHELLASTLLPNANSLLIHQSFKSLFTDSSYVKFGRPLSLFLLLVRLITLI